MRNFQKHLYCFSNSFQTIVSVIYPWKTSGVLEREHRPKKGEGIAKWCSKSGRSFQYYCQNYVLSKGLSIMALHESVQIRSFFWSVFCYFQTEYRKIRTRKNSIFGHISRSLGQWPSGQGSGFSIQESRFQNHRAGRISLSSFRD